MLFLGWLPADDIIRTRKLSLLHKICNGCGPEYLSPDVNYVKSSHNMITTREPQDEMILSCQTARKIQASEHSIPVPLVCGTKLIKPSLRDISFHLQRKITLENLITEYFNIKYTY